MSIVEGAARPSPAEVHDLYIRAFSPPPLCEGEASARTFTSLYEDSLPLPGTIVAARGGQGGALIGVCYGRPWRWEDNTDAWATQLRDRLPRSAGRAKGWRSLGHAPDAPDGRPALVLGLVIGPAGRA